MFPIRRSDHSLPYNLVRILTFAVACTLPSAAFGQDTSSSTGANPTYLPPCTLDTLSHCFSGIAKDQFHILTSPLHIHKQDLNWILPLAAATGMAFALDRPTLAAVSTNPLHVSPYRTASDFTGIYAPIAGIGAGFLAGAITHDDHLRETALLAGEALADTGLFTEALKYAADRVRPAVSGLPPESSGEFWSRGYVRGADSFPSGHSAIAFAFAHVVAGEYPGWKVKLAAYGLAAATAFARVQGREHFPSDVLAGGAIGYLIGGYVVHLHHPGLSGHQLTIGPMVSGNGFGLSLTLFRSRPD